MSRRTGLDRALFSQYGKARYDYKRPNRGSLRAIIMAVDATPEETVTLLVAWAGLQDYVRRKTEVDDDGVPYRVFTVTVDPDFSEKGDSGLTVGTSLG